MAIDPKWQPVVPWDEGFDALYGLEIDEMSPERAAAHVPVRNAIRQPMGLVPQGMSNATSFLRPILEGTIHATALRRHRGRTTWIWDVEFTDDDGRLCAVTRMTIAVRAPRTDAA